MNPSFRPQSALQMLRPWLVAGVCLLLATVVSVALAQFLLAPAAEDLRALAVYLALSGSVTVVLGRAGLSLADRAIRLGIRGKILAAGAVGSGVGLVNVFVIAKLMFLSNVHDLRLLVALLAFSGLLTTFFAVWVAGSTTGRLQTIAAAIRSLAAGDYARRVEVRGRDEAAELAATMNELAERLAAANAERAALDRQRRELTAGISHDLRTPLASLRAMVDALDDGLIEDTAEISRYYATMRREIERLMRMIEDLLELAQLDAGVLRLNRSRVSALEIAADVVDAMQPQAAGLGLQLSLRPTGMLPELMLDGARIERAIANLIRNAFEHTPAGGRVDLALSLAGRWLELDVSDSGEGVGADQQTRIWDRFYRGEPSRSRRPGAADGAGLGLAIVRGIVEAHGGTVAVHSAPQHGATFSLRLPLDAAS